MDKIFRCFLVSLVLLGFIYACNSMNDIQSQFAEEDETIFLGRVDSLKAYPGFGRVKICWSIGSDPRIEQTVIYWNMRKDSIVKDFVRTTPGDQKDSIILEDFPEGKRLYEFRNTNSKGETSLYSSTTAYSWGASFAESLLKRKVISLEYHYNDSKFIVDISPSSAGDSVVYSKLIYTDTESKEKTLRIEREVNNIVLPKFPDGGEFKFQTVFFLPHGMDTVYNNFESYRSPKVVFDKGKKIVLGNGKESKYFEVKGNLYEWNSDGDLLSYRVTGDGSFELQKTMRGIVSRDTYKNFFFYDDDKFISVSTANGLSMHQIKDEEISLVKKDFGSSFSFPVMFAAKGFFYSLGGGTLKVWNATNNGTWATPSNTNIATDFHYAPLALFKHSFLIGVDENGILWSWPISTTGQLLSKNRIGQGWNRFERLVTVGNILLAMDSNGDFWKFNFDTNRYWIVEE